MIVNNSKRTEEEEEEESSSMASTPKKKHPGSLPLSMFIHLDGQNGNPECPHASNPYHTCADYCLSPPSEKGRVKMGLRKDIHPRSVNVFSPIFRNKRNSKQQHQDERGGSEESNYLPKCKNASNPYHECSEYCSQNTPRGDQGEGGTVTALSLHTNYPSPSRLPNEKHAESFFPECAEDGRARKVATEDESSNEGTKLGEKTILNPECIHASNPYHKCAEYCIKKVHEKDTVKVSKSMEKKMDRNMAMKMKEPHECRNASDACPTCCFPRALGNDPAEGVNRKKGLKTVRWNVHPDCRYASNPYHICVDKCFDLIREMGQVGIADDNKKGAKAEKKLNTQSKCVYASNPYHKCANYCLQKDLRDDCAEGGLEENKKGRKMHNDVNMQPKSVSPSYQNSVEYCSKKFLQKEKDEEEEGKDCFTATPYLICSEHLFQLSSKDGAKKDGSSLRPSSPFLILIGLIFILVYVAVTTVVSGDNDVMMREHRNVKPKCKDASDANHRCV